MRTKNELFLDVVNWLIDEGFALNQGDVAEKAGLGPNVITRIKKGKVKEVSEDTIRAICARWKFLNIDYVRGKSEHISLREKAGENIERELREIHQMSSQQTIDPSSTINAALAAQMETIANLKQTIADMKEQHKRELAEKDSHIADLAKLAEERLHRIAELRRVIDSNDINMGDYPFPIGAADYGSKHKNV